MDLYTELQSLLAGETDFIARAANFTAWIYEHVPDLNWAGIYRLKGRELVLGPFQGKPACVRIAMGKGVCGTAAQERRTLRVPDVHAFPGHIACDAASQSELVVPLLKNGQLLGVLDLDSPRKDRFSPADQAWLERLAELFMAELPARPWP